MAGIERRVVEPGVVARSTEGLVTHFEIDLNRVHIYDGNGLRLEPGMIPAKFNEHPKIVVQTAALRRLLAAAERG